MTRRAVNTKLRLGVLAAEPHRQRVERLQRVARRGLLAAVRLAARRADAHQALVAAGFGLRGRSCG